MPTAGLQIPNIILTANDPNEDMGIYVPGTLGDSVLCVSTGQGLNGITVTLFRDFDGNGVADGGAIATTTTATIDGKIGFYQFTGLQVALAGDPNNKTQYLVQVDVNDPDLGSCNVPVPPTSYNPPLDSNNPNNPNNDFSFKTPAVGSIGDTVWRDDNGNSVQDAGEPGIPNVTVDLNTPGPDGVCGTGDDVSSASDVTDGNGNYLFTNLAAGTYCSDPDETTVPAGYQLTTNNDPETVNLGPGENFLDADFGYQPKYTLGDRVWYDQDQDGIQDATEPGYNGATVNLYNNATCSGSPIANTTTGTNGFYQFTNLATNAYCLQFGNIPAGWSISPLNQGDGTNDSSANSSAQIPNIILTANDPNEDMGIYVPGTLGDSVLCVSTGQGLNGITVTLFRDFDGNGVADGGAIATTTTATIDGKIGFYQFTGLQVALAGDPNNKTQYLVQVDVNDPDLGSCNVPVPPTSYNPPLDSNNPNNPNNDFSFKTPAVGSIGDTVWRDDNGNSVQDAGEPGIPNVTVALNTPGPDGVCGTGDDVSSASKVTDGNGKYLFTNLAAGTYCADPDETTVPAGYQLTTNNDPETVNLGPGENFLDADFGYQPKYTLGDRVWYDQDQDGIQDGNEPGYNGATVNLYNNATCSGSPIANTTTGTNGFYQFTDLATNAYCLQFGNIPAGWSISPLNQGDGTNDNSANSSAQIPNIILTANDPNEDMGIYVPGTLGDSVLCVSTGQGLNGITVTLFRDFDGNGVADGGAIATTTTATIDGKIGFYQFTGLQVALAGDPNNKTQYLVQVDVNDPDLGSCNVPVPPTSYNPPLDSNNPNNPNNDFSFNTPALVCNLGIDVKCLVAQPTTQDLACTSKIAATTLRYIGPSKTNATVEFLPKSSSAVVYTTDLISGQTVLRMPAESNFTVNAQPDDSDLGSKMTIRINGVEEIIHTSCSVPYVAGKPAPLDSPKGAAVTKLVCRELRQQK